jgi:hypothetical protein
MSAVMILTSSRRRAITVRASHKNAPAQCARGETCA